LLIAVGKAVSCKPPLFQTVRLQFPAKFAGIEMAQSNRNQTNIMNQYKNPKWWTNENDSAWSRVKEAMKRDWDQTKHDFGGDEPDTNQSIGHTLKQASGTETLPPRRQPTYEQLEPAHRFGHGARVNYADEYPVWDDDLETTLKQDWESIAPEHKQTWMQDRAAIRYGWDFDAEDTDDDLDENDLK
jgi:hypothetical protein